MNIGGKYQVDLIGSIISIRLVGMFDLQTSKKLSDKVESMIRDLQGAQFSMLFDLTLYEGSTPDAHELGNQHAMWLEQQNCSGKAIVCNEQFMLNIIRNQQQQLNQSKIRSQVFNSIKDAETWLSKLK